MRGAGGGGGRFSKLSLKRNKSHAQTERKPDKEASTIVLDDSFDNLNNFISSRRGDWSKIPTSPIVIDDSLDFDSYNAKSKFNDRQALHSGKVSTPNGRRIKLDSSVTPKSLHLTVNRSCNNRPSPSGWSPAQQLTCSSPKFIPTPSSARDIANESSEQCSIKTINESFKNILDDLYGEAWKSIPTLFKKKTQKQDDVEAIAKRLDFDDESDKENYDILSTKKKYLEDLDKKDDRTKFLTPQPEPIKKKKKLFTENYLDTPKTEVKRLKRELKYFTEIKPQIDPKIITVAGRFPEIPREKPRFKSVTEKKTVKSKQVIEEPPRHLEVKKLTFMGSLADDIPTWRCDHEALSFKQNYKSKRDQLTRRLFVDFNHMVFDNRLEDDMPVIWDGKLRSTAGTTTNRLIKTSKLIKLRTSSIKLSTKVIDGPQRLRDTLIHELCHAATWIIDHELRAGHGPLWKKWAKRALQVFPELVEISRCHDMEIHFKYSYKCTQCGYRVNRHSKSIDTTKKACGYCRGTFELIVNKKTKDGLIVSTPARQGEANEFAKFVKDHYGLHKNGKSHADVMKILSEQYSLKKNKKL